MLYSPDTNMGTTPSQESSTSESTGLFSTPPTPQDWATDNGSTNKTATNESLNAFDWNNWDEWTNWDGDNALLKSPAPIESIFEESGTSTGIQNATENKPSLSSPYSSYSSTNSIDPSSLDNNAEVPVEDLIQASRERYAKLKSEQPTPVPANAGATYADFASQHSSQGYSFSEPSPLSQASSRETWSATPPEDSGPSNKKRKSLSPEEQEDAETPTRPQGGQKKKRASHNMVEKRYRMNLNEKIDALRDCVPKLKSNPNDTKDENAEKINKGMILTEATEYIRELEKRVKKQNDDLVMMQIRLNVFKTLAQKAEGERMSPTQDWPGIQAGGVQAGGSMNYPQFQANTQTAFQNPPIPNRAPGPRRSSGGYMSKMMVGGMAGLMMMQGYNEQQQMHNSPGARGLFAFPTQYLGRFGHILQSLGQGGSTELNQALHLLLKIVLLFGAVIYIISPSFFDAKPRDEKAKAISEVETTETTSLASPVEVRRNAWLTATQTVWVPHHNFALKTYALFLKFLKLGLRNTIGWHRYAFITGATEEQELARVKAWDTALDAQLAGGDAEISMSGLLLTIMASKTLPETPYRLMLKALHIHILLWEAGSGEYSGRSLYRSFAAKVARRKWERARQLQLLAVSAPESETRPDVLPEYLAKLLELDIDAVMVDSVIQRAYNLAWNRPTDDKTTQSIDGMDSVIDDPSIRSPLDALAAWYAYLTLSRALSHFLSAGPGTTSTEPKGAIHSELDLAKAIAPPTSSIQICCVVAQAVLLDANRGTNIAASLQVLSRYSSSNDGNKTPTLINSTSSAPKNPLAFHDLELPLRCAMVIALLKRPGHRKEALNLAGKLRFSSQNFNLLRFTAVYLFLDTAFEDREVADKIRPVVENGAKALKLWINEGGKNKLGKNEKVRVETLCLGVFNWLLGIEEGGNTSDTQVEAESICEE